MIRRREFVAGIGAMLATRLEASRAPLEVAYVNAKLWTGRPRPKPATAFGTIGNRIATVGEDADVRAVCGKSTRVIDLGGAFALPGFMDNHTHFLRASFMLGSPELRTAKTREEFVERVGRAARAVRPGRWLQGGNWDEQMWGGELPTRAWIDGVTADTPVAIVRLDQHLVLLNSLALRLAGIDRNTPDPAGGLILKDAEGEPTGLLKDKAAALVKRVIPPPSDADVDQAIVAGAAYALSKGITQVHVTELDWTTHHSLRRLRAKHGLQMRFYSFVPIEDWRELAALVKTEGHGDDWVRWGGVKGLIDGSLGSRTALFHEPYADDPRNHGLYRTPPEQLRDLIVNADAARLHVTVHAIGDAGNKLVLDMFAEAAERNGPRDRRFRIEHAQHLLAQDIPRFAQQEVIASIQPYHAVDDGRWAVKPLGERRLRGSWAMRSLLDAQASVTFGSDWPVAPIDPLLGVDAAVLRRTIDGAHPLGWTPEQRISVTEALTAYTSANAHAGFQEDRLGVIAQGYLADIVVLDTDLTKCDPARIRDAKVIRTIVDGRTRFGDT
ncbi:MAG TPA: amidohydrolase [Steroidobacteraceae bacterium]|nr:amidohydrolase [Steroidobacteraceae bacterium]